MDSPEQRIPDDVAAKATCVAIVPSYKKGAFVIGSQDGQGVVTCRTASGWSAPAFIDISRGSFGFQAGGDSTDLILISVNKIGTRDIFQNKFKIGADVAAASGPVGRNAQAGTDLTANASLFTYSRSRGLFAGIDLNGAFVSQNQEAAGVFYGGSYSARQILAGDVPTPDSAKPFLRTVARYFPSNRRGSFN